MTRPLLATCLLALSIVACALQSSPIHTMPLKREQAVAVFTSSFVRHNFETRSPLRPYYTGSKSPRGGMLEAK